MSRSGADWSSDAGRTSLLRSRNNATVVKLWAWYCRRWFLLMVLVIVGLAVFGLVKSLDNCDHIQQPFSCSD